MVKGFQRDEFNPMDHSGNIQIEFQHTTLLFQPIINTGCSDFSAGPSDRFVFASIILPAPGPP